MYELANLDTSKEFVFTYLSKQFKANVTIGDDRALRVIQVGMMSW